MRFSIQRFVFEKDVPFPLVVTSHSLQSSDDEPVITEGLDFVQPFPTFTGSLRHAYVVDTLFRMEVGDSFLEPWGMGQSIGDAVKTYVNYPRYHPWNSTNRIYDMSGRIFKNKSAVTMSGKHVRRWWRLV